MSIQNVTYQWTQRVASFLNVCIHTHAHTLIVRKKYIVTPLSKI